MKFRYDVIPVWYVERAAHMLVSELYYGERFQRALAFNDGIGWCWLI